MTAPLTTHQQIADAFDRIGEGHDEALELVRLQCARAAAYEHARLTEACGALGHLFKRHSLSDRVCLVCRTCEPERSGEPHSERAS